MGWMGEDGYMHYYANPDIPGSRDHAEIGAELARHRLKELRYPNDRIDRICFLIENHMWATFSSRKGARKFLNKVGSHADDLFTLRWADNGGHRVIDSDFLNKKDKALHDCIYTVSQVKADNEAFSKRDLAVDGHDMMELGLKGPAIGQALDACLQAVIDDPSKNNVNDLLYIARRR